MKFKYNRDVTIVRGQQQLAFFEAFNPDRTKRADPVVEIVEAPVNGTATVSRTLDDPDFSRSNVRWDCNRTKHEGLALVYRPNPGFVGSDVVAADVIFPDGVARQMRCELTMR